MSEKEWVSDWNLCKFYYELREETESGSIIMSLTILYRLYDKIKVDIQMLIEFQTWKHKCKRELLFKRNTWKVQWFFLLEDLSFVEYFQDVWIFFFGRVILTSLWSHFYEHFQVVTF